MANSWREENGGILLGIRMRRWSICVCLCVLMKGSPVCMGVELEKAIRCPLLLSFLVPLDNLLLNLTLGWQLAGPNDPPVSAPNC